MTPASPTSTSRGSDKARHVLYSVWLAVAVLWCGNLILRSSHLREDADAYVQFADNLGRTHTLARTLPGGQPCPSAYRPPLYPMVLALVSGFRHVGSIHVALLHLMAGLAIATLTFDLARRLRVGAAWLVAMAAAVDPLLLFWSAYPMTETAATVLALLTIVLGLRWYDAYRHSPDVFHDAMRTHRPSSNSPLYLAGMWGVLLGVAALCRPVFLAWGVLLAVAVMRHRPSSVALRHAVALVLGAVIVLTPWAIRNHRLVGVATPLTTHGGYTLLLSNNPAYYRHLRTRGWRVAWDARELQPLLESAGLVVPQACSRFEGAYDQGCRRLAVKSIQAEPAMFARSTAVRIAQLWSPLPHAASHDGSSLRQAIRYGIAAWYVCLFGAALLGVRRAWSIDRTLTWIGLAGCLAFTLVHSVYFSNMRMRTPLMPWFYLMAAVAISHVFQRRE